MSVNQDVVTYDDVGGSFWDINGYKRTSKRVNDGYNLCNDLVSLVRERSEIENKYAASLRSWNKKWAEHIGKGPEYGTTEAAWQGLFTESERLGALHSRIRDRLVNEVLNNIKAWQKENYSKQKLGGLKQHKEIDDGFVKAQKPWQKKLDKVIKSRDEYHKACKSLRTAEINERNLQGDTSVSEDQKRKNIMKIEDWEKKKELSRAKYDGALQDITGYNARYMEDMTEVFDKCQVMEERRQNFVKQCLFDVHDCLNLSTDPEYSQIYNELRSTINNADAQQDLKWWSQAHGVDMPMNWPEFEEYSVNQANISKKGARKPVGDDGIKLTMIKKDEDLPPQSYRAGNNSGSGDRNTYIQDRHPEPESPRQHRNSVNRRASYEASLNPFGDEGEDLSDYDDHADPQDPEADNPFDEDEVDDDLVDDGRPGVPIRALYDYNGADYDELTFKAGEEFEKLEEEDDQGWCKGRLRGRVGLYPANFCAEL